MDRTGPRILTMDAVSPSPNLARMCETKQLPAIIIRNNDRGKTARYESPFTPNDGEKRGLVAWAEDGMIVFEDERDLNPISGRPRRKARSIDWAENMVGVIRGQAKRMEQIGGFYASGRDGRKSEVSQYHRWANHLARCVADAKRQRDLRGSAEPTRVSVPEIILPGDKTRGS